VREVVRLPAHLFCSTFTKEAFIPTQIPETMLAAALLVTDEEEVARV
jgi:hypothetical protein